MPEGLTTRLDELESRLELLERKQQTLDTAIGFIRWFGPIAVGLIAVLIGNYH